jgi:hypothetical protein
MGWDSCVRRSGDVISMMRKVALYRGTDGKMRTLSQTAEFMGITAETLRLKWFGTAGPAHVRNDGEYWRCVKRRALSEGR